MITCAEKFLWRIEAALGAGGAESAGGSTGIPTPRHAPLRDAVQPGGTDEAEETTQVTAASSTADSFPSERVFLVEVEAHAAGVAARCVAAHERLERLAPFGASLTPRTGRY
ncbi:hypothetical protein EAH_00041140 [Eimeria acervulina]|uniref:Uncharacterized protein n=1 Tax=Eimeria acervulina TaxID=5801 RepID=U6GWI6_EIMAC|nr:hypothetical protein EAH_00041140 [Eimeria acervulina]CDI83623.1 hypothetical protein EAH_00041140 [Eimeria acervulina]